ncbi:LysR family transcriptional regulator [Sinirhodobacter ferrireducens]|uniref:LysR family transcriptional regulator n=1 Tax=Paenirhodobacter ferrireducens TaxID=1215032 RepID=A0A443LMW7_9RHOB|nr:LysR family transcriptional regulator [Sinirhodobacter ferrireducens]RWR50469.1 LysR family transcriptional regulator [Sinirhodobacter ferrireducens]
MNFRQIKYFVATAETGQVSRAASALSISQSAVTTAIRELETEIGTALFTRTAHGMEMTQSGRELLALSYEILTKIDEAVNIRERASGTTGRILVATTYTVIGYFLPYHLDRIARMHPNLDIQVHELNRESVEEGLLANRFDIAIVLTSNISNPELETDTLLRSPRRLWLPQGHRLADRRRVQFSEISEEDYIMLTVDEAANTTMKYWTFGSTPPQVKMRTSSIEAVRSMVANGQGVTVLSDMVYRPWSLEGRRIVTVETDPVVPSMDVGLAWRRGTEMTPATQVLYSYFRQAFSTPQI